MMMVGIMISVYDEDEVTVYSEYNKYSDDDDSNEVDKEEEDENEPKRRRT